MTFVSRIDQPLHCIIMHLYRSVYSFPYVRASGIFIWGDDHLDVNLSGRWMNVQHIVSGASLSLPMCTGVKNCKSNFHFDKWTE